MGLWANIHAKRKRGERMRKPGEKGAPTAADFKAARNEEVVGEAGPFTYGAKKPRKGSVADLANKKRQEQERGKQPIEPKDQMVGVAKVTKGVAEELEVKDTDDYKLSKSGKKVKAHKIIFNKGEDDGKKGVTEQMKKSFNQFVQEHTPELTEEQLDELVAELQEVLGKDDPAGKWISDFVHSDNPKFAGKSKEKRKQMALAAYYAKQRNEEAEIEEELKGKQHKLDKNKNGKLDAHDFKLLRKEDAEQVEDETLSEGRPYSAMHRIGRYGSTRRSSDLDLGGRSSNAPSTPKPTAPAPKSSEDKKKNEEVEKVEEAWPGTPEYKKKFPDTERTTGKGARHDIKKTATGVIATRRFSDNDEAEKPKDAPKRGRGRPKKDKFAEAVDFLIGLDEETFDSLMEDGFDSFMEQFEQLDELSKTTLGSYARKAAASAVSNTTKAQQSKAHAQDAMKRAKDPKLAFARSDNEKLAKSYTKSSEKSSDKASKRLFGVNRALSRLTK